MYKIAKLVRGGYNVPMHGARCLAADSDQNLRLREHDLLEAKEMANALKAQPAAPTDNDDEADTDGVATSTEDKTKPKDQYITTNEEFTAQRALKELQRHESRRHR